MSLKGLSFSESKQPAVGSRLGEKSGRKQAKQSFSTRRSTRARQVHVEPQLKVLDESKNEVNSDEAENPLVDPSSSDSDSTEHIVKRVKRVRKVRKSIQVKATSELDRDEPSHYQGGKNHMKSCKDVEARIQELSNEWIGKVFEPPEGSGAMKETVMRTISTEESKFSKYSGIQQFKNAIILFTNVGGKQYQNNFIEKESNRIEMDWFASNNVSSNSPIVQKLLAPESNLFLFLRFEDQAFIVWSTSKSELNL